MDSMVSHQASERRWTPRLRVFAETHAESLLSKLIGAPSVNPPGRELQAAEVLADFLRSVGLDPELHWVTPRRPNVLARVGGPGGPRLALCSHLDVVPAGDVRRWSTPPFRAVRRGDQIYGRGSADAKGSLAAMALCVAFLAVDRPRSTGEVILSAVCGEERGGTGSRSLVEGGFRVDAVVIGEPTQLRVAIGHKGRALVRIRIVGPGGHASRPTGVPSPVHRVPEVLERLERLALSLPEGPRVLGRASLAVTGVRSRQSGSASIPWAVDVTVDRRLVPGESHEQAGRGVVEFFADLPDVTVSWRAGAYPTIQDVEQPIVHAALAAQPDPGHEPVGFLATCDLHHWARSGIPGVIMGPGRLEGSGVHAVDEHISLAELIEATVSYGRLVLAFADAW